MKQQFAHLRVKKRRESMRTHRKRLKNFSNSYMVDQEQFLTYRTEFQVNSECSAVWLAHLVWDQGVVGSNPTTPTNFTQKETTMSNGGKGSKPRPYSVDLKTFDNNWAAIFQKDKQQVEEKETADNDQQGNSKDQDQRMGS